MMEKPKLFQTTIAGMFAGSRVSGRMGLLAELFRLAGLAMPYRVEWPIGPTQVEQVDYIEPCRMPGHSQRVVVYSNVTARFGTKCVRRVSVLAVSLALELTADPAVDRRADHVPHHFPNPFSFSFAITSSHVSPCASTWKKLIPPAPLIRPVVNLYRNISPVSSLWRFFSARYSFNSD